MEATTSNKEETRLDSGEPERSGKAVPAFPEILLLQARVLDSMSEGVRVSDERGYILYTNPAEERMFGYAPGELGGQHITAQSGYPAEENAALVEEMACQLQTGSSWAGEWLNKRKDGSSFYSQARVTAAELQGNKYWIRVQEDITRQKLAETAGPRLAAIVECSDDAIVSKDLNGIITSWNKGAEAIFGYTAEEAIGKPVSMLAPPGRLDEFPNVLARLRAGERISHYETERRRKDGAIINISLSVSPVRNSKGEITGASKIARDITARRLMEETLAAREEELRTLLASLPDIVARFDRNLRFCYVSLAVERATGFPPAHYLNRTHTEAGIPPAIAAQLEAELRKIFETGRESSIEFQLANPDGDTRDYLGIGIPEFGAGKHVKTVLTIVRDTTDQKRAEQAQQSVERELLLLVEASSALLGAPHSSQVLRTIIELAQQFGAADAHAVWRKQDLSENWRLVSAKGLSERYVGTGLIPSEQATISLLEPAAIEDVQDAPFLAHRKEVLRAEGIESILVIPLKIHGAFSGTVVFYWKTRHAFTNAEIRIANALGNLAGAALGTADLYERQIELRKRAEWSEQRSAFLAEAGALLSSSLDYETTLGNVAKLAVPGFADWCTVDILDEREQVQRVAVQHSNPEKIRFAFEFAQKYPPREDDISRIALRTGKSILLENIPDEDVAAHARDAEHLRMIRELGLSSLMIAPMLLGNARLGIITFVHTESRRSYTPADLQIAEEIARRAASAIAHARLFARELRSNEELRRVNEDLNQFAYSASHDLQEPLRMVAIYSQLLQRKYGESLDSKGREYMRFTLQGAQRMEMLVKDLLAYTQAANSGDEGTGAVDASAVLEQALTNLQTSIEENQATVTRSSLPLLQVKAVHLLQLFQNLIGNAIKYRSTNLAPEVAVSWEDENGWCKVCVTDNGIGVPAPYAKQIFGIFKRLHAGDKYSGTGIGLAICQRIVERYGGRIWVESEEGNGSRFCFTLPRGGFRNGIG